MRIEVLGSLRVRNEAGEPVELRGEQQRRLVALLVAGGQEGLSLDRLIEGTWNGATSGRDRVPTFRTYVARLRRLLGDEAIETRAGGYALRTGAVDIDLLEFERLLETSEDSGEHGAVENLGAALALWRDPAFGELASLDEVAPVAVRLDERRTAAEELWLRLRLEREVPGDDDVVTDARSAVDRNPYHQRLWGHLMTALYRSGRQAEALKAFQDASAVLGMAGLEPDDRLVELDRLIATDDLRLTKTAAVDSPRGYELLERLGEGAFSVVYRARQTSVGREVAIKQIRAELANRPEFIRGFESEARLIARLEHPSIVPLYDFWRQPGSAYLAMRLLDGGTLESVVLNGAIGLERTLAMVDQIASALTAAHDAGVIHRDVKPANILFDLANNAYLGDFGIAVGAGGGVDPSGILSAGSPAYASPEQLRREPIGPPADVHGLAISAFEALTGRLPFAEETTQAGLLQRQLHEPIPAVRDLKPNLPVGIDAVLQQATAKDPAKRHGSAQEFADALRSLVAPAPPEVGNRRATMRATERRNPFKGLRAFDEADRGDFAGRDRLTAQLVSALDEHRLVAIVGPSGAGKSSVVRASLLPALQSGALESSGQWFTASMLPGEHPFDELEVALHALATSSPGDLSAQLRDGPRGIARTVRRVLPVQDGQLVLLIDQFEELFTLCADDAARDQFLNGLVEAVTEERSRVRVVLTLRADFYDRPLRHRGLGALVRDATVPVLPLAADELEQTIVEPAAKVGCEYEPGLVARIIADVIDQPGALPLLQYALTELYERQVSGLLTAAAYDEIGGVAGALAQRAEQLFQDADTQEQQAISAMFARLVTPGEGTEDTRRRALRTELPVSDVVEEFGAARLLAFDHDPKTRAPTVEVAHEALLRSWPRLRSWVDAGRDDLRALRHLHEASNDWNARGRPSTELYRGDRLDAASQLALDGPTDLTDVEQAYVDASRAARNAEQLAEERHLRRLRSALTAVGVVAVIAMVAAVVAVGQRRDAQRQGEVASIAAQAAEVQAVRADVEAARAEQEADRASESESLADLRRMVAEAADLAEASPRLAALVALEAYRSDPSPFSLGAIQRALVEAPTGIIAHLSVGDGPATDVDFLTDTLLAVGHQSGVSVVDVETGEVTDTSLEPIALLDGTHDGRHLLVSRDDSWLIYDTTSWRPVASGKPARQVTALAIAPDGSSFLLGYVNGQVDFHDADGRIGWSGAIEDGEPILTIRFRADGELVAATTDNFGSATVWEVETGSTRITGIALAVEGGEALAGARGIGWDLDGQLIVTNQSIMSWFDPITGAESASVELPRSQRLGWLQDRKWSDRQIHMPNNGNIYELVGRSLVLRSSRSAAGNISDVAGSAKYTAMTSFDGVVIGSLDGAGGLATRRIPAPGDRLVLSPDGQTLITALPATGTPLRIFDLAVAGEGWEELGRPEDSVSWELVSRDERLLIPGGFDADGSVVYAPYNKGQVVEGIPTGTVRGFFDMHFIDDDRLLFGEVGGADRLLLYDRNMPGEPQEIPIARVEGDRNYPSVIARRPSDGAIVVATRLGHVHVLDPVDLREIETLAPDVGFTGVDFSRDGSRAITRSVEGIQLRDGHTLEILKRSADDSLAGRLWTIAFLGTDEKIGVANIGPERVQLFDVASLQPIGGAFPYETTSNAPAFAEDAKLIGTWVDGQAVVWDVDTDRWPELACRFAGRDMTEEEWSRYGPARAEYRTTCSEISATGSRTVTR